MQYRRVCEGLKTKGILVPVGDAFSAIGDRNKDYYMSMYFYNQKHFEDFQSTGTIAGITDVQTPFLVFDFDSESDVELARQDTIELCNRLLDHGLLEDQFNICFSGKKGFSVDIETNDNFNPDEFRAITASLSEGLSTRDSKIVNPGRVVRVPKTRHQGSGLFKLPITLAQLKDLSVESIKKLAGDYTAVADAKFYMGENELPDTIKELKVMPELKQLTAHVATLTDIEDVDYGLKPKGMPSCKYSVLLGFFRSGDRSVPLMALAAHLQSRNYPQEASYYMLKSACKAAARRYPEDPEFSKEELWSNIIEVVYSPTWKGGKYSCATCESLKKVCPEGFWSCENQYGKKEALVSIGAISNVFAEYAKNIDKNTVPMGIPAIDQKIRLQTNTHVVIAASAGVGKCLGKGTPVMLFDGTIKPVEAIKCGDLLMGDDSTPRKVLSTCKGKEKLYKVKQSRAEDYVVNASHILSLRLSQDNINNTNMKGDILDINIEDYLKKSKKFKTCTRGYRVPVEFPKKEVEIDPYILGYWLGNGEANKPQLTIHQDRTEVINYIKAWAEKNRLSIIVRQNSENSRTYDIVNVNGEPNLFVKALRELKVYGEGNKHIPEVYKLNDRSTRLNLLAGLLDANDYSRRYSDTSFELVQKSKVIALGCQELSRTLGFAPSISVVEKEYDTEFSGIYYINQINGNNLDTIPVKLPHKKTNKSLKKMEFTDSTLQIEDLGEGDYYGFEINGNRRFLLGDCTVTHNTSLVLNILQAASQRGQTSVFCSLDMADSLVYQKLAHRVSGLNDKDLYALYRGERTAEKLEMIKKIDKEVLEEFDCVKFDFSSSLHIDTLEKRLHAAKAEHGDKFKLVVIDFINLLHGNYSDSISNLNQIAPKLKDIANDLGILIISLAQISRAAGSPNTPLKSSRIAKGSSAIEESATVLFGLWRPFYNTDHDDYISIAAVKTRMGKEFMVDLHWDGLRSEIRGLTNDEFAELKQLREQEEMEGSKKKSANPWG